MEEKNIFTELTGNLDEFVDKDIINTVMTLPDEEFSVVSALILEEMEKALANPQDRALLRASFQNAGMTAEDVIALYKEFIIELENAEIEGLSPIKIDFFKRLIGIMVNGIAISENEQFPTINIPIELMEGAIAPTYAHEGDGAMDIYALEDYTINPGETVLVKTGIKVAIPFGFALLIQPRSGQSLKTKLRVANTPGLIDSGYRDEIGVIIENIEAPIKNIDYDFIGNGSSIVVKSIEHGQPYVIEKGQRIAQMRLVSVPTVNWTPVENVGEIEGDRLGGFGSSGIF